METQRHIARKPRPITTAEEFVDELEQFHPHLIRQLLKAGGEIRVIHPPQFLGLNQMNPLQIQIDAPFRRALAGQLEPDLLQEHQTRLARGRR